MKKLFAIVLAAVLLCLALPVMASAAPVDITAEFTDPAFRAEVYKAIGKTAPAPIYDTDVAEITELWFDHRKIIGPILISPRGNIKNLAGLEFFTGLEFLDCSSQKLTSLPKLPAGLQHLNCSDNQLTSLPKLPDSLQLFYCNINKLTSLPELPDSLEVIRCMHNQLTSLPALPSALRELSCAYNQLSNGFDVTGLLSLIFIDCRFNGMTDPSAVTGLIGEWDTPIVVGDPGVPYTPYHFSPQRITLGNLNQIPLNENPWNFYAIILFIFTVLFGLFGFLLMI